MPHNKSFQRTAIAAAEFGRYRYLLCNTGLFAVLKPLISPTNLYFWGRQKSFDIVKNGDDITSFPI
jgi:hypothetical protein